MQRSDQSRFVGHFLSGCVRAMDNPKQRSLAKCCIDYQRLDTLMKERIKDVGPRYKHLDDYGVLEEYKDFFLACAAETAKLNGASLAKIAKELFKMPPHDATMWGGIVSRAFSAARIAWDKASTGSKLPAVVKEISLAMQAGKGKASMPFISSTAVAK